MFDQPQGVQVPSGNMAKDQPNDLRGLSLKFLEKLKDEFGEHSPQSRNVHETLGTFKRGELSKRDVHTTILEALEGHEDLRQGLMGILLHPEAKWIAGDFDLPIDQQMQPILEPTPKFLQPTHQPQIRLPSISSSWFPLPQVDRTAGLGMFSAYNRYYNGDSSPKLPMLAPFQLPEPPSHLWVDHSVQATYKAIYDDGSMPPPIRTAFRNPWQDSSYDENFDEHYQRDGSPALTCTENIQLPVMDFQEAEPDFKAILSEQGNPRFLDSSQLLYDLLTPPTNHRFTQPVSEEQYLGDNHVSLTPASVSPQGVQKAEEPPKEAGEDITTDQNHSLGGPFIHALCGKGFATPSKVKKHHWGKKHNDLATTTGCWAKHMKPDIAWDDHPSCKDRQLISETTKSVPSLSRQIKCKAAISEQQAHAALDALQQNTIPGFPTLDDLPHTVAKALNTGTVTIHSPQELESRYHTHQSPPRFGSLLTAVNLVSQIDAPQPQSQTDSIALHLDAQVAATERHAQHASFVLFRPLTSSFDPRIVRPVLSSVLDIDGPIMGVPSTHGMTTPRLQRRLDQYSSVHSSNVEKFHAAAAVSRSSEPTGAHSSGSTRKKRKT